jgi:hypothetical protein
MIAAKMLRMAPTSPAHCHFGFRPRAGRRPIAPRKYLSANLPSRLRSGPPQLRQRTCSTLSCEGGASTRTSLYCSSQFGHRNWVDSGIAAPPWSRKCHMSRSRWQQSAPSRNVPGRGGYFQPFVAMLLYCPPCRVPMDREGRTFHCGPCRQFIILLRTLISSPYLAQVFHTADDNAAPAEYEAPVAGF